MPSCGIPTPSIPNIFKYKLYRSLQGLPIPPVVVVTPDDFSLSAIPSGSVSDRPLEVSITETSLKDTSQDHLALALEALVDGSATSSEDVTQGVDMHSTHMGNASWIHKLIPELERLMAEYHVGNYVVVNRDSGEQIFESMPIYARCVSCV